MFTNDRWSAKPVFAVRTDEHVCGELLARLQPHGRLLGVDLDDIRVVTDLGSPLNCRLIKDVV